MENLKKELTVLLSTRKVNIRDIVAFLCEEYDVTPETIYKEITKLEESENFSSAKVETPTSNFFVGIIKRNRSGRYIEHQGKKYKIKDNLHITGDKVEYLFEDNKILINKIVDRKKTNFICEVKLEHGEIKLTPFSESHDLPININVKEFKYIVDGDRVKMELSKELIDGKYNGMLVKKICNSRDMDSTIKTLCEVNGFPTEFSKGAMEEAKNNPTKVLEADSKNHKDYRQLKFFTIDGSDTKDRDDAINIEKTPNGEIILRVAISDVSHYIKPNSHLYNEGLLRGNSVYTPGAVNPQFPQLLTNGILSLNEGVDRLVKIREIRYNHNGNIISSKKYNAIIHSRKAFTHDEVNDFYEKNIVAYNSEKLIPQLIIAKELSDMITESKYQKGYLKLLSDEIKYEVDNEKEIKEMGSYRQGLAQEIIENFMVSANNEEAKDSIEKNVLFIYRNHQAADEEKIKNTLKKLVDYKLVDKALIKKSRNLTDLLNNLPNDMNKYIASRMILLSLCKAYYGIENIGHSGLALDAYGHTTSPVRRGADYINQIIYDSYVNGTYDEDQIIDICAHYAKHFSEREIAADLVEYAAESLKVYDYLCKHKENNIKMTIVDINHDHLVVKQLGLPEGIIPLEKLPSKTFYDKNRNIVRTIGSNKTYRVNDHLNVTPSAISENGIVYELSNSETPKETHVRTRRTNFYNPSRLY